MIIQQGEQKRFFLTFRLSLPKCGTSAILVRLPLLAFFGGGGGGEALLPCIQKQSERKKRRGIQTAAAAAAAAAASARRMETGDPCLRLASYVVEWAFSFLLSTLAAAACMLSFFVRTTSSILLKT